MQQVHFRLSPLKTVASHCRPHWRIAAVCSSAVLCRWAIPPGALWPAVLCCWVPLIVAVAGLSWRRAAILGFVQGTLVNILGFWWTYSAMRVNLEFGSVTSWLCFACLVVLQGARSSLLAGLVAAASLRAWPRCVSFPLALVTVELIWPMVFPWYTGHFALVEPAWAQLAEIGGPFILSAWVGAANAALAEAWLQMRHGRWVSAKYVFGCALLLSAVTFEGRARVRAIERHALKAPAARVGVVQGNLDPSRRETRNPIPIYRDASLALVKREPRLDLLVWPEEAIYFAVNDSAVPDFLRNSVWRGAAGARDGQPPVPLLIGMLLSHARPEARNIDSANQARDRGNSLQNAALLVDRDSRVVGTYVKRRLMPVGEYSLLPDWFRSRDSGQPELEYVPGVSDAPLVVGSHQLGLSICYEDILHGAFRSAIAESKPDLLVNLTSDGWFRHSPGSALHLTLAQLRSIEHRRYFLRATETGTTALIGPTGKVLWSLPVDQRASGAVTIHWLTATTIYEQLGDWPWCFAALATALMVTTRPVTLRRGSLARGSRAGQPTC